MEMIKNKILKFIIVFIYLVMIDILFYFIFIILYNYIIPFIF